MLLQRMKWTSLPWFVLLSTRLGLFSSAGGRWLLLHLRRGLLVLCLCAHEVANLHPSRRVKESHLPCGVALADLAPLPERPEPGESGAPHLLGAGLTLMRLWHATC